jgi:hypothetical protein
MTTCPESRFGQVTRSAFLGTYASFRERVGPLSPIESNLLGSLSLRDGDMCGLVFGQGDRTQSPYRVTRMANRFRPDHSVIIAIELSTWLNSRTACEVASGMSTI